jgi:hypothetical protein
MVRCSKYVYEFIARNSAVLTYSSSHRHRIDVIAQAEYFERSPGLRYASGWGSQVVVPFRPETGKLQRISEMKTAFFTLALALAGAAASTSSFAQDSYGVSQARPVAAHYAGKLSRGQNVHLEQQHALTGPEIVNLPPFVSSN